jgi:predicted Na+-dependent transporter
MKRVKALGALLLLTLAAPLALAQDTWTPTINVSFLRDWLVSGLKWTTYIVVIAAIVVAVLRFAVGYILARLGAHYMARAVTEKVEAFLGLVWLAVGLVLFPLVVYALAKVGALPPWVANLMSSILQEIWSWSPG